MSDLLETEQHHKAKQDASQRYLTFQLGRESYGIAVLQVREIIRMQEPTVVPQMPDHVKGVINLRGKVIPVIDLRIKLELPSHENTEMTCIIVVHVKTESGSEKLVGVVVDAVEEVLNLAGVDIEDSPDFGNNLTANYIVGMAKVKGGIKTLLNINKVISEVPLDKLSIEN